MLSMLMTTEYTPEDQLQLQQLLSQHCQWGA